MTLPVRTLEIPELHFANRQRRVRFDLGKVISTTRGSLPLVLERSGYAGSEPSSGGLKDLGEVGIVFVSDRKIAELHARYMNVAGPTDVITFQHGEIAISADTAAVAASRLGSSIESEQILYAVHGLLHLNGYDDLAARPRDRMHRRQEQILARLGVASVRCAR